MLVLRCFHVQQDYDQAFQYYYQVPYEDRTFFPPDFRSSMTSVRLSTSGSDLIESGSRSGSSISGESGSGSRILMTKNQRKKIQLKLFYTFFWSKIAIFLSVGLHKAVQATEAFSSQKRVHLALQKMKFINCFNFFSGSFLPLPDRDPQHWYQYRKRWNYVTVPVVLNKYGSLDVVVTVPVP